MIETAVPATRPAGAGKLPAAVAVVSLTMAAPRWAAVVDTVARWLVALSERLSNGRPTAVSAMLAQALSDIATMRIAMDHVGRGVQMIDETGRIVVANAKAAEMLGVAPEFLASKPLVSEVVAEQWRLDEFKANSEEVKRMIASHGLENQPPRYRRLRPDGRVVEVDNVRLASGGVVRTHTDVTDRHEAEQRVLFLAHNDFLTGLANRAGFQQAIDSAVEGSESFAVVLIDVDYFKQVNDTFGHTFGDALLKDVARRIRTQVREGDLAARIGGDELAILIAPVPDRSVAEAIAAQIVDAIRLPFNHAGRATVPSASVGVTFVPGGPEASTNAELALWQADTALYCAKAAGRGCWKSFDPSMATRDIEQRLMLVDLRTAFDENQFHVFYQPIVDPKLGVINGFEALIRWQHPSRGLLAAAEFIHLVEASGLIVPLGLWVLKRACEDALAWPETVRTLVNLSPRQLSSPGLVDSIRQTLTDTGLSPHRLELEITESSIIQSVDVARSVLTALRTLGVRVALDDFGTGFSSLSHVRTLPFDTIKIDSSFVSDAAVRADSGAIVRAITSLARDLGIRTIAEGVETERQLDWIQSAGCDEAQGYLFSRPIPKAAAQLLLRDWTQNAFAWRPYKSRE